MNRFFYLPVLIILFSGCANKPMAYEEEPILKYPIILVHGVASHDRRSMVDFWGRIPKELRNHGIAVYFGNTDAWGTYESNAAILKETVDRILLETNCEKVNIIAQSKGGIDARYFIWAYNYGDKVASLTTVSTPHHGAELADFLYDRKLLHSKIGKRALNLFGKLFGDTNPDVYSVNFQLTTKHMKEFNEKVTMDENVYYQCFYSVMENEFDDPVFYYTYLLINKTAGPNDGVVSEASARWSDNITKIENISHVEIIDVKKRKVSGIHIPDIYIGIARGLGQMGF